MRETRMSVYRVSGQEAPCTWQGRRHMSVKSRHHHHHYGYSHHNSKQQRRKCRSISDRFLRRAGKKGNSSPWEREQVNYGKKLTLPFKPRWTPPNLVSI